MSTTNVVAEYVKIKSNIWINFWPDAGREEEDGEKLIEIHLRYGLGHLRGLHLLQEGAVEGEGGSDGIEGRCRLYPLRIISEESITGGLDLGSAVIFAGSGYPLLVTCHG